MVLRVIGWNDIELIRRLSKEFLFLSLQASYMIRIITYKYKRQRRYKKIYTKMTRIRCNVGKTKVVSTISGWEQLKSGLMTRFG